MRRRRKRRRGRREEAGFDLFHLLLTDYKALHVYFARSEFAPSIPVEIADKLLSILPCISAVFLYFCILEPPPLPAPPLGRYQQV